MQIADPILLWEGGGTKKIWLKKLCYNSGNWSLSFIVLFFQKTKRINLNTQKESSLTRWNSSIKSQPAFVYTDNSVSFSPGNHPLKSWQVI